MSSFRALPLLWALFAALPVSAAGCAGLAALMNERLAIMETVAAYKHREARPVADPPREAALLDAMAHRGRELGIPAEVTASFFRAQIEAAKIVQRERIAQWEAGETPPREIPDLAREIRPMLDRLSASMLESLLSEWQTPSGPAAAAACLAAQGYSPATVEAAIEGWPRGEESRTIEPRTR